MAPMAVPIPNNASKKQISFRSFLDIVARALMSILFLASGTSKITSPKAMQEYMKVYGVPGYLLYPAAALELSTGTMLILGVLLMEVGTVLSGWCILTASIFHRDWQGDGGQTQQIMFMKNLCLSGGFLILAASQQHHTSGIDVLRWVKEQLSMKVWNQARIQERASLLPKDRSPLSLYGGERRLGQIV